MRFNLKFLMSVLIIIVIGVLALLMINRMTEKDMLNVTHVNNNLLTGPVKLLMEEDHLIRAVGEGSYNEGFGGHMRMYKDIGIDVGIQDGLVTLIEVTNPAYSVFGIHAGDALNSSIEKILSLGFTHMNESVYEHSGIRIAVHGASVVNKIQLWVQDHAHF